MKIFFTILVLPILIVTCTFGAMVLPRLPVDALSMRNDWPLIDTRIVGGDQLNYDGEVPYQVSLQRLGTVGWGHSCGGSILSTKTIITAAHCVYGYGTSNLRVAAGSWSLTAPSTTRQIAYVSSITVHKDYSSTSLVNDIALLRLSSLLILNQYVDVITLQNQGESTKSGTECIVTGWGTTFNGGLTIPDIMRKVTVPIVKENTCEKVYGSKTIKSSMICAGYSYGGSDACQGDSGGPLVKKGTRILVGVVSWGYQCALPNYYGVYTRVSSYTNWIKANSAYSINSSSTALLILVAILAAIFNQH